MDPLGAPRGVVGANWLARADSVCDRRMPASGVVGGLMREATSPPARQARSRMLPSLICCLSSAMGGGRGCNPARTRLQRSGAGNATYYKIL
jgi:hypothetical protein